MKAIFTTAIFLFFFSCFPSQLVAQTYLKNFKAVGEIAKLHNYIIFAADDGKNGVELWKSDGTVEGTVLLKDIATGGTSSNPASFINYKDELYFSAYSEINGNELWKTDGTKEGTVQVIDLRPYAINNYSSSPRNLTVHKNKLYFTASDSGSGSSLWKTDGTVAGTEKVYQPLSSIASLTPAGNRLFFISNSQLWSTDGTRAGTINVNVEAPEYHTVHQIKSVDSDLYIITRSSFNQKTRLFKLSDGSGTPQLFKYYDTPRYGSMDIDNLTPHGGELFFSVRTDFDYNADTDVLWKTNGTEAGTLAIKSFDWARHWSGSYMQNFVSFGGRLFFSVISDNGGHRLWATDGTAAGTLKISDVAVNNTARLTESARTLYFNGSGELWSTDGSTSGTKLFADLNTSGSSNPNRLLDLNGTLYFTADDGSGLALWSNQPQPEIQVRNGFREVASSGSLLFTSKVDSIAFIDLKVKNLGHRELIFSDIHVSGSDFYIDGTFSRQLLPNQEGTIRVIYFPSKTGKSYGNLTILNNDLNEGRYVIKLEGDAKPSSAQPKNKVSIALERGIIFSNDEAKVRLDNNTIPENSPVGSIVGKLSVQGVSDGYTFSLAAGMGDLNNADFVLSNNIITTASPLDFGRRNSYTIRVKASGNSQEFEQAILISVTDVSEDVSFSSCETTLTDMSYSLLDVAFVNNQKVLAIGSGGKIIKSDNGGKDWVEINSGVRVPLKRISFTDEQTGYIVADNNTLLKTENGGEDWFLLESPSTAYPYLNNMYFVNSEIGFVFGGEGKIYKTADGGRSWASNRQGFNNFVAGHFTDELNGFICGASNTLLKTADGGETWVSVNMSQFGWNTTLIDITFVSDKVGYILGQRGEIIKTLDAGKTWSRVGRANTEYGMRMYFLNENEGYVIGGWGGGAVYKTVDGGVTWTQENLAAGAVSGISFSKDGQRACIVGSGTSFGSTGSPGRTIILKEPGSGWAIRTRLYPADFGSVHFTNEMVGFLLGDSNYKTEDGGITWKEFKIGDGGVSGSFHFVSDKIAYVENVSGIERVCSVYKTTDAGETWNLVLTITEPGSLISGIHFLDSQTGFVHGWNSSMYKTVDGGKSWSKIKNPIENVVRSLYFVNSNTGFAVGNHGELIKTNNKGKSWVLESQAGNTWLHSVYFLNSSIGFIAGDDGYLSKTTDGGATWTNITTGIVHHIMDIKFVNESIGYAATHKYGGIGNLYKTTDGGQTWFLMYQTNEINNIGLTGKSIHVASDRGGFIKVSDGNKAVQAGYIKGEKVLAEATRIDYYVEPNTGTRYTWSVEPSVPISYSNNTATVVWDKPGVYKLKVTPYNSCGWAEPREETVIVEALPTPEIIGSESATAFQEDMRYYTKYNEGSRYTWIVQGHESYVANGNEVFVTWGEQGQGRLEVIETLHNSGTRKNSVSYVTISSVTGLEDALVFKNLKVFPNPSVDGYVNIELNNSDRARLGIKVVDVTGRVYRSYQFDKHLDAFHNQIDISYLPTGMYMLEIRQGGSKAIRKIIKM